MHAGVTEVLEWRPTSREVRAELRAWLREVVPDAGAAVSLAIGYAFCPLTAAIYLATCRLLAPGLDAPPMGFLAVTIAGPPMLVLLGLANGFLAVSSAVRFTAKGIAWTNLRWRWKDLVGWRTLASEAGVFLLIRSRSGLIRLRFPPAPLAGPVLDCLRAACPEDQTLEAPDSRPKGLLLPSSALLLYAAALLYGLLASLLDATILRAAIATGKSLGARLVLLEAANVLIGPGLLLGWWLLRRGTNRRLAVTYWLCLNLLATQIAMLFSFPFFIALHASR